MYAKVFKIGNGNNQHGRPFPTKGGHQGDGSKVHSAIGLEDLKAALGAANKASGHSKKMRAANPDHKMPAGSSRFAAYSTQKGKVVSGWAGDLGLV